MPELYVKGRLHRSHRIVALIFSESLNVYGREKLTLTLVSLPAGVKDTLHRHDVYRRGEQRAVHPVLQAARRRGSLSGGRLEALQVRQEQPRQDGHSDGGMKEAQRSPEEEEEEKET